MDANVRAWLSSGSRSFNRSSSQWILGMMLCCLTNAMFATERKPSLSVSHTETGVRYGIWAAERESPAPTLFILAASIEETLGNDYFRQAGTRLAEEGYLCVSIDLPAHGRARRAGEPSELAGWRWRLERSEDIVADSNRRLTSVLDHLIATGRANPDRVAVCGTSRGGFLALHFAAFDRRVRAVAAYAPVTDLAALREFRGAEHLSAVTSVALKGRAENLCDRKIWIVIGDRDERVGTDKAIGLARTITAAALQRGIDAHVALHVIPEPKGHTTPHGAAHNSALWLGEQLRLDREQVSQPEGNIR